MMKKISQQMTYLLVLNGGMVHFIPAGVARAVELGGDGPVCALGTLYFSGDVRQAFARLTAE